jgi:RNA polymerase sigma-70 factor (ECF subfamily)
MANSTTDISNPLAQGRIWDKEESMTETSFSELYRRHVNKIYYYIYSRVQNSADAEDLTSQTFITALETRHKLRDEKKFTPWLYSIARNKTNDHFRRNSRRSELPLEDELFTKQSQNPTEAMLQQERLIDLERILASLKPIEQEYLRLRLIAELPFAEIAQVLNMSESSLKKSYYRLLERLQAQAE